MSKILILVIIGFFGVIFSAMGQVVSEVDMFEHLTEEEMLEFVSNYLPQSGEAGNNNSSFIRQIGNENTITSIQEQEGNIYNQVIVDQYGTDNSANLILDHFEAPYLKVEQMGGASVTIQHSAFSFPMKQ